MKYRFFIVIALVLVTSCASIREMTNALMSMKDMQFRISKVANMKIAGIDVSRLTSAADIQPMDAMRLVQAYHSKSIKATLTVLLEAKNPNDGSTPNTKPATLTLKELPWTLYYEDRQVVSGVVRKDIPINGGSVSQPIPLDVTMDLSSILFEKGYEEIMQAVLDLGGANGSPAKLTIKAKPTVSTPFGIMTSPNEISIVSAQFRAQ